MSRAKKVREDFDLGVALYELRSMAGIAETLLEDMLGGNHQAITGRPDTYHLTRDQFDYLMFAVYQTSDRARVVCEAYNEHGVGKGGAK